MRKNLSAALSLVILVAACESTSRTTPGYSGERANDPSNSKIHALEVSGDAADTPSARAIDVAIFRTTVSPKLRGTIKANALFAAWRSHFERDAGFRPVEQERVDRAERSEAAGRRLGAAARVYTVASSRPGAQLVLMAHVESNGQRRALTVQGKTRDKAKLVKALARKVKQTLRNS